MYCPENLGLGKIRVKLMEYTPLVELSLAGIPQDFQRSKRAIKELQSTETGIIFTVKNMMV